MNILITTGMTLPEVYPDDITRIMAAAGPGATVAVARNREEALLGAVDADVILGFLSPEMFERAERLTWVHAIASGVDGYLFPEFKASPVQLTGEKGLVGGHLADHAFALLLALTRQLATAIRLGPDSWSQRMEMRRREIELEGMRMAILGFGGTGRAVARRAVAFGMRCRTVDAVEVPLTPDVDEIEDLSAFPAVAAWADVLAVCCPLTPETRGLVNAAIFARMKPTAIVVNVTRGEIINGDDLVAALREGQLGGAALDVAPEEPLPPDHPLWTMPNVVMTPHTAGASQLRAMRNIDRFCDNLVRLREGQPLDGVIDKEKGY